jgi:hypothetical protein
VSGNTFRVGDASKYFEVYTDGNSYKQLRFFSSGNFETTLVSTGGGNLSGYNSGNLSWQLLGNGVASLKGVSSENFTGYNPLNFTSSLFGISTTNPAFAFNVYTNSGSGITVKRLQMFNGDNGKIVLNETGGNVLIGTTTDVASSKLTIESTTQGVLFPRMTTTQKNAIASPATGLMVYDTTLNLMALYNGTTWTTL